MTDLNFMNFTTCSHANWTFGLTRARRTWSALAVSMCLLPGCRDDGEADSAATDGSSSGADGSGDDDAPSEQATYWRDVAPLFAEHCIGCHREGGAAPFALETYEQSKEWAPAASLAISSRTVPPWLVTDDGSCGDFADSRWMPDTKLDVVQRWIDAGLPEGVVPDDPSFNPEPGPVLQNSYDITTPTFVPQAQGDDFAQFDEYRCFLVDPELASDRFLTGYEVLPGNEPIVHHVLVMPVDPAASVGPEGETNLEVIEALDSESPDRDGWPCYGAGGEGVDVDGIPVTWAPGMGVVEYPEDIGVRIPAGHLLIVQVHYNLADPQYEGESDRTRVRLGLTDSVEREGVFLLPDGFLESLFTGQPDTLEPGRTSVPYSWELPVREMLPPGLDQAELHGVFPHMHEYGRAIDLRVIREETTQCAAEVPRWDFGWQLYYFYEQPMVLRADDTLKVTCDFDTSSASDPILPGWGTYNEMCLMGLFLVP